MTFKDFKKMMEPLLYKNSEKILIQITSGSLSAIGTNFMLLKGKEELVGGDQDAGDLSKLMNKYQIIS